MNNTSLTPTFPHSPGPWQANEKLGTRIEDKDGNMIAAVLDISNVPVIVAAPETAKVLTLLHRYHSDKEWAAKQDWVSLKETDGNLTFLDTLLMEAEAVIKKLSKN
jgi:hypothetical protein